MTYRSVVCKTFDLSDEKHNTRKKKSPNKIKNKGGKQISKLIK